VTPPCAWRPAWHDVRSGRRSRAEPLVVPSTDLLGAFLEAYRLWERSGRPKAPLTWGGSGVHRGSGI
jgi:hypothetical protein